MLERTKALLAITGMASGTGSAKAEDTTLPPPEPTPITRIEKDTKTTVAKETPPLDLNVSLYSTALSRNTASGLLMYNQPSLQSGATISGKTEFGTFYLDLWSGLPLGGDEQRTFTEFDVTAGVTKTLGEFRLNLEHASFLFPIKDDNIPDIKALKARIDWDNTMLPTYIKLNWNYDGLTSLYGEAGISKPITLTDSITVTPSLRLGTVLDKGDLYSENGLSHIEGGTKLEWKLNDSTVIHGTVDYLHSFQDSSVDGVTVGAGITFRF